jgi:hypothetical protein
VFVGTIGRGAALLFAGAVGGAVAAWLARGARLVFRDLGGGSSRDDSARWASVTNGPLSRFVEEIARTDAG